MISQASSCEEVFVMVSAEMLRHHSRGVDIWWTFLADGKSDELLLCLLKHGFDNVEITAESSPRK